MQQELQQQLADAGRLGPLPARVYSSAEGSVPARLPTDWPSPEEAVAVMKPFWRYSLGPLWLDEGPAMPQRSHQLLRDPEWQKLLLAMTKRFSPLLGQRAYLESVLARVAPHHFPFLDFLQPELQHATASTMGWLMHTITAIVQISDGRVDVSFEPGHLVDYYDDPSIAREIRRTLLDLDVAYTPILSLLAGAAARWEPPPGSGPWPPAHPWPGVIGDVYVGFLKAARRWLDLAAFTYDLPISLEVREPFDWAGALERHRRQRAAHAHSVAQFEAEGRQMRRVLPPPASSETPRE